MTDQRRVEWLLNDLCAKLGFGLPPDARRRLALDPPADPDEFTDAVLAAEGLAEPRGSDLWRQVRAMVTRHRR